jgi:hypothetical protein
MSKSSQGQLSSCSFDDIEANDAASVIADAACPIGQQLIGMLFGFLMAVICLLSFGNLKITVSCCLAIGSSFGSLAAAISNPLEISCREFLIIFTINEMLCLASFSVFDCGSIATVFFVSLFVAGVSSPLRQVLHFAGVLEMERAKTTRMTCD